VRPDPCAPVDEHTSPEQKQNSVSELLAKTNRKQALTVANVSGSLLTVEDVAEMLKVPVSWVYARTRKRGIDRIPGFRLGKYWRFRQADLLTWLERQRTGGRADV
jgi:excisionase family DNA binding protein